MQEVNEEQLKALIKEAKEEGKDVSELEAQLSPVAEAALESAPLVRGERKEKTEGTKKVIIESTGPAREEDFE